MVNRSHILIVITQNLSISTNTLLRFINTADPAVRAGIAGSTVDLGAEIVADGDADNTTTAGEARGTATPVNAGRSRRRRFDRGASR
jgi:hypothetical protein